MFTYALAFREVGDSAGSCCPSVGISALEKAQKCVLKTDSQAAYLFFFFFLTQVLRCSLGFSFSHMSTLGNHPWATVGGV